MQKKMIGLCSAAVLCAIVWALPVRAEGKHDHAHAKLGHKAPDFTLKDLSGKEHTLSKYTAEGKTVVLEWFNHGCPVCAHHATKKTVINMVEAYKDKNVVFFGIDSSHKHTGKEADVKAQAKKWGINYAILTDFDGKIGHQYAAKTTPHMFIIKADGTLVYDGAIDDKDSGQNYVTSALDQILAKETVAVSKTKPYGCSVKYKKKG